MINGYRWCVVTAFAFCLVDAFVLGATSLYLAWGPAVAAGVISYRSAAVIGALCQFAGVIAFGPHSLPLYLGLLRPGAGDNLSPELVMYSLLCVSLVLPIWQLLALWQQAPTASYLGAVFGLLGTLLLYPGLHAVDFGRVLRDPPFISGLGPIYASWATVPVLAFVCVAFLFLFLRNRLLRGDDPFHKVLWCLPALSSLTMMVNIAFILYAVQSPTGYALNTLTPQGTVLVLVAWGIGTCLVVLLAVPLIVKCFHTKAPKPAPVRHMSLLGLPDDVVRELAAEHIEPGRVRALYAYFFKLDLNASIRKSSRLMQLHSTAETFDRAAETLFTRLQIVTCMLLSMSAGVSTIGAMGPAAGILHTWKTGAVTQYFPVPLTVRCAGGVMMTLGAVLAGRRLMPLTGVQLARMTPFRSYVAVMGAALASIFARQLHLNQGIRTYIAVSSVVAVGLVEGLGQVNWPKVALVLAWWLLGPLLILAAAAFVFWQGILFPAQECLDVLRSANKAMQASTALIAGAVNNSTLTQDMAALRGYYLVHPEQGQLKLMQEAIAQLVDQYKQCTHQN